MKPTRLQLLLGFGCIYIIWGSTYLAIRWGVATIPPFLMGGTRFLIAGSALYGWHRWRGAPAPNREQWKNAFLIGTMLLFIGNGAVSWASQHVSSGMTSLLVATVPMWLVLAEVWQGRRPAVMQWIGVAIGLVGVGLLVVPADESAGIGAVHPGGAIVLAMGSLSWTIGSLFSRTARLAQPPAVASGMQMLCGGVLLMLLSGASGEWAHFRPEDVNARSFLSFVYLIVFGSLIGFSAYMWLLRVASPAAVGTYAYVNPVVAVLLGVFLAGETLPPIAIVAMLIIVGGVALVSLAPYWRTPNLRVWNWRRRP